MNEPKTIRDVFEIVAPDFKVTEKLANDLNKFENYFVNKKGHAEFFSGNILGVHRVVYTPEDNSMLVDDIIQIDDVEIGKLVKTVPFFKNSKSEMKNATRPIYLILVWLVYKFNTSNLKRSVKESAMVNCMLILQYIMYTSALYAYFPRFLAPQDLMEAVFERMSLKYNIRKHRTWRNFFINQANNIFDSKYIHKKAIEHDAPDESIVYIISDNKTRINSIMKHHYDLIKEIKDIDGHIRKSKIFVETQDGVEIKSLERELAGYRTYIHSIIGDRPSFIKEEILTAVFLIMSRKQASTGEWKSQCKEKLVLSVLEFISDNHAIDTTVQDLVDNIMTHCFIYIYSEGFEKNSVVPIPRIADKLKGLYQSSLGKNKELLSNRKTLEKLITKNFKGNSVAAVKSTRTAVMLYIVIRTLARRSYA